MEKREECWFAIELIVDESACRRLIMKRESKMLGRLEPSDMHSDRADRNIHAEGKAWHDVMGGGRNALHAGRSEPLKVTTKENRARTLFAAAKMSPSMFKLRCARCQISCLES